MMAATSASSASAAHWIAQAAADVSSSLAAMETRNSDSWCVDQLVPPGEAMTSVIGSGEREYHERLVVEATDTVRASDLAVGVEARHGSAAGVLADALHLGANALVAEHAAPRDAVEREQPERGRPVE